MKNKLNVERSAKDGRIWNNQSGALLIGLIITMVIISVLSGAMVYIFSSSTLNPVSGKYAQQAYYNAEAGFRYLTSVYRNEAIPDEGRTAIRYYEDEITPDEINRTITLPGGGTALITMSTLGDSYTPTTATATLNGSDLDLSAPFPDPPGFFSIGTEPEVYRYMEVSNGGLKLTGISPSLPVGFTSGNIETKEQTTITSVGTYGASSGLWNVNRKITYAWVLSGFPSDDEEIGEGEELPDLQDLVDNNPFGNTTDLGRFVTENVGGGLAITVDQTTGGAAEAVLGYSGADPNPFKVAWQTAGNYLSYDIQVKIGTGVWVGDETGGFDKVETVPPAAPSASSVAANGYIAGLTFRSKGTNPGKWEQLGLDFAKYNSTSDGAFPAKLRIYPDFVNNTSYSNGQIRWDTKNGNGFFICDAGTCTYNSWTRGAGWIPYDPPPMILLWIRFGNSTSAEDFWLAYMKLHGNSDGTKNEPSDGIVDGNGLLKDWSTIMLRVVEGASLRFDSSTTGFQVGDTVSNGSGSTGKVFKKIQYNNSGTIQDVIILNNITIGGTAFATGQSISSPNQTPAIENVEYRARDNYIWAMFGDTDAHLPADDNSASDVAINNYRRANARIVDDSVATATGANINDYIHWPPTNIDDWGSPDLSTTPVSNDYFKLVRWDTFNINQGTWDLPVNMLIMGTGKEAGAILRTSQWTTGTYTAEAFPYEVGFHSVGTTALKTYFDDLAINFPGQTTPGGVEYVPPVQN